MVPFTGDTGRTLARAHRVGFPATAGPGSLGAMARAAPQNGERIPRAQVAPRMGLATKGEFLSPRASRGGRRGHAQLAERPRAELQSPFIVPVINRPPCHRTGLVACHRCVPGPIGTQGHSVDR